MNTRVNLWENLIPVMVVMKSLNLQVEVPLLIGDV